MVGIIHTPVIHLSDPTSVRICQQVADNCHACDGQFEHTVLIVVGIELISVFCNVTIVQLLV